ncbi:Apoptosis regulatory protein Siva, partial [Chaetura pelagica]
PPVGVSKACSSCVRTAGVKEACTQCDQFVCQNCSRLCSYCNTLTCSLCSTIDYGDVGEQVLCNGCSIFPV